MTRERFELRLDPEMRERLSVLASEGGSSAAKWIKRAISLAWNERLTALEKMTAPANRTRMKTADTAGKRERGK